MAQRMRGSQGGHRRKTAGSQTCWAGSRRRGLFQDRRSSLRVHAPRWRGRSHGAGRATPQSTHAHGAVGGEGWRHAEPPATDLILQMKDRREPMHMRMDDCCPSFFTVPVFRSRMRPRGEDATSEGRGHGHQPLPWWGHGHREPPTPRMPCGWAGHKGVCQQPPMQHQTPHSRQNCTRGHRGLRRLPAPVAHALPVLLPSALGRLRSSPLPLQLCAPVTSAGQRPHAHASGTSPSATATLKGGHALPGPSRSLVSPTP